MRRYCLLLSLKALGYHVVPSPRLWCFVQPKITNLTARLWSIVRAKIRPRFRSHSWAAVWPVLLDFRVSQRFGTRNRPINSLKPFNANVVVSPPVWLCYVIPVCYLLELVKKPLFL
ncbi:Uncharacterized protein HZ326_29222 [Fusarium oxysporum f. sp. albedinis]|nr:Uncharacterized protein HZ326_29222 [Fusarium oxysporum f. sp. albedinis]